MSLGALFSTCVQAFCFSASAAVLPVGGEPAEEEAADVLAEVEDAVGWSVGVEEEQALEATRRAQATAPMATCLRGIVLT
ncbi:hypothetical protein [uncultured Corynebacterium sp.]|uniref:hypothetical protein n=1 Tax=uncultured Corynebacterium sp. TaxID=159447 RepID=UPI0025E781E3|nr:hypothetical protein [uncultured Corynebacterium sp.]